MAMLAIGAGIAAAGSMAGGAIAAGGANAAGSAAAAAGRQAFQNAEQVYGDAQKQIGEGRAQLSPWTQTAYAAQSKLASLYGLGHLDYQPSSNDFALNPYNKEADQANALAAFQTSPGYQFRLQQGINALDRSAAAKGMLLSGAQTKGVQDYGQNTASNEWGNYLNGLTGLSSGGLNAAESGNNTAAGLFNTGANAFNQGNNALFQGNMAQASSYQNAANALASGISRGANTIGSAFGSYGMGGFGGLGGGSTGSTTFSDGSAMRNY